MRVRVCDDVETIADGWVTAIQAVTQEFDVTRMPAAKEEVSNLLLRKLAAEKGDDPMAQACGFDDVDILCVDYDLLHLDDAGGRTTGEGVARLARTFSTCGVIVVMNQFKGPQFDLGMRGHLDSFADVNIDANLVGRGALWNDLEPAELQFDPTIWTPLPKLLAAARGLSAALEAGGFDAPIMPAIGLAEDALGLLSDTAYGFLSLDAETAVQLAGFTVGEFLRRSLSEDLVETLSKHVPKILFDFTAFRIAKWLDRAVLRPMDVLIDGEHLVDRLPFMIDPDKADVTNASHWARAAAAPDGTMRWDLLEKYKNENASLVLGRTVFDWYRLAGDEAIDKLQDAYLDQQQERFYLAEDTSRFVNREAVTRYRADFHNFGDRRAIERLPDITYGPMRRVSFG
jgi:hypothetical protein